MASLGLLSSNNWTTFTLVPKGGLNLYSSSSHVLLLNNNDETVKFNLGYAKLLKPGIELIETLDVPTDDRIMSVMNEVLETDVTYWALSLAQVDALVALAGALVARETAFGRALVEAVVVLQLVERPVVEP